MNPLDHAKISVKKRGGAIEDYYPIHFFMDSTKELCSDNRHRVLHNLWGIRRVVIPIFGASLVNSDGRTVNIKDMCEQDHILPDYSNKFIPTLNDFVNEFAELSREEQQEIDRVFHLFSFNKSIQELMISPLNVTGQLKALRLTHNTWFCNEIIPKLFSVSPRMEEVSKVALFENMGFKLWMDNGTANPASKLKITDY